MADALEARTLKRIAWRFIPFLIICYFVAYLDRVNVGFAKLTMDAELGLSETAFGFGAGVFFLAYFLFEVPSNIILDKVGARRWIARIMLSWGVVSGAMAFIPQIASATGLSAEHTFYLLRVLLGFAEAGFFPGIIFFLTLWFPASHRARIVGYFMAAIPLSSAIGSPGLGLAPRLRRRLGSARLAVAVRHRGPALDRARLRDVLLPDRPARRCDLARPAGANLAAAAARARGPAARARLAAQRAGEPRRRARAGAGAGLFRRGRLPLRRRLLAADDRQGLRPVDRDDRLGQRHPLRRRLPRHGLVGPAFGPGQASARCTSPSRWRSRRSASAARPS